MTLPHSRALLCLFYLQPAFLSQSSNLDHVEVNLQGYSHCKYPHHQEHSLHLKRSIDRTHAHTNEPFVRASLSLQTQHDSIDFFWNQHRLSMNSCLTSLSFSFVFIYCHWVNRLSMRSPQPCNQHLSWASKSRAAKTPTKSVALNWEDFVSEKKLDA